MKIRMTKLFVLNVLRNEPIESLAWGQFISDHDRIRLDDPECASCAVGTVIKRCLAGSTLAWRAMANVINPLTRKSGCTDWTSVNTPHDEPANIVVATDPWRALSIVYETSAGKHGTRVARRAAVRFVEKHFPAHVELDIDGLRRRKARGISVVR